MGKKKPRKNAKETECDSEEAETTNRVTNARIGSSKEIECDSDQDQTENQVKKSRKVNQKKSDECDEEEVSSGNRPYRAGFSALSALVRDMNEKNFEVE
ncbi:uncharacterized protein LOC113284519 isoform X2 [Papaver somniferum]|uniref:uncharacterized protein LOC113284519 isoform X2 n=1 Tax=Papaver somniferum TaxID=3469 RepID=UPI000E70226B|nr:uncharacterized protein LOC113284519 isoform X2 [Papaver somniferum]